MRTAWRRALAPRALHSLLPFGALGTLALSWSPLAYAHASTKTVVMVVSPSALPLAQRLRQEIESLGLAVKWLPSERAQLPSLEQEAASAGAVASIRIAPMGGSDVDMSIFDRATGKTVSFKLIAASSTDPAAGELIATRSVELLRASLLQTAAGPEPAKALTESARPPTPPASQTPENLSLALGPAVLFSTDFRPGAHVLTGLTWMPFARVGVSGSALVPVLPQRLGRTEGAVDLYGSFYRLGFVLEAAGPKAPVSLRLTAAAGLGRLQLRGQPSPNYEGVTESRWVACPTLGVAVRFALAPHLRLFVDGSGSIAFPKTVIRVAGREATEWGRPMLSASLGLELSAAVGEP